MTHRTEDQPVIRWIWGYDRFGVRCTEAEAVGFLRCFDCGGLHACPGARRVRPTLTPLSGRLPIEVVGQTSSEFHPDEEL